MTKLFSSWSITSLCYQPVSCQKGISIPVQCCCKLLFWRPERAGKWKQICLRTVFLPTADRFSHYQLRWKSLLRSALVLCHTGHVAPLLPVPVTEPRHPRSLFLPHTHPSELVGHYFVMSSLIKEVFSSQQSPILLTNTSGRMMHKISFVPVTLTNRKVLNTTLGLGQFCWMQVSPGKHFLVYQGEHRLGHQQPWACGNLR